MPPTSLSVAGVQGLPFIISANNAKRTEMTLPSSASPLIGLIEKGLLVLARSSDASRASLPYARPNATKTFRAWSRIEEINGCDVLPFDEVGSPGPS